jgi:hypothetical protein
MPTAAWIDPQGYFSIQAFSRAKATSTQLPSD